MADDRLSRTFAESDVPSEDVLLVRDFLSSPNMAHHCILMYAGPIPPESQDSRHPDVFIIKDSQGTAKFGGSLTGRLQDLGAKVNEVDLQTLSSEREQQAYKKFRESGVVTVLVVSLKIVTSYWHVLEPIVAESASSESATMLPIWYNVDRDLSIHHAPGLRALPEWPGSETDDTDFQSTEIMRVCKDLLKRFKRSFIPLRQSPLPSDAQRRGALRKYRTFKSRPSVVDSLYQAFFQLPHSRPHDSKAVIVVATGPPGFGKTAAAEEFAQQYGSYYSEILVLRSSNKFEWTLSMSRSCEMFGMNAKRFYRHEWERVVIAELTTKKSILLFCDDYTDECHKVLKEFIGAIRGPTMHILITTQLEKIGCFDHYTVEVGKLSSPELQRYFSPQAGGLSQLDVLGGHPTACSLARYYFEKTGAGIWALKPQYHGIWAELYFTYGKDKLGQWLEKHRITHLRSYLAQGEMTSLEDVAKASPSFVEGIVPESDKARISEALKGLERELDDERLNVMIHLNLSTVSRAATSIMNMLSVLGDDWFEFEVLVSSWSKQYKDQSSETAKRSLESLEKLGLVQIYRFNEEIRLVRVPRCFQQSVLERLTKDRQTTYKKIVQCLAYHLSRRLPVYKVWSFDGRDAGLFSHALSVAKHCKKASLFTISARNIIAFGRELVYVYSLSSEAKLLSEHLLKMEQLVPDNTFSICREKIRVELAESDIFSEVLTDSLILRILHVITKHLCHFKLYRLAVIYLEKEVVLLERHPERSKELSLARVSLAEAYSATGRESEAKRIFDTLSSVETLMDDDRMKRKVLMGRAETFEKAKDYHQAKSFYTDVLKLVPPNSDEHAQVLLQLGEVSAKAGHHLDAFGFFNRLLERDKDERLASDVKLKAQHGIALSLQNQGELQDSLNSFQTLHSLSREYDNSDYQIVSLMGQGDVYSAARMLDSALRLYEQSLQVCEVKLPTHRDRPSILLKIGHTQRSRGNFVAAKEAYENCVSLSAHVDDKRTEASALSNIGSIYQQTGDLHSALRYYKEQLRIAESLQDDTMIGLASGSVGNCYSSLREYDDAIKHILVAVEKAEKIGDEVELGRAYSNLGNVYQLSKKYVEAEDYFRLSLDKAVATNDIVAEARARGNLGNALQSQSRFDEAVALYKKTIELSASNRAGDKISEGNAYHNQACALEGMGEIEEARDSFIQAIKIFDELYEQTGHSDSFKLNHQQLTSKSFRRLQYVLGELGDKERALEISERSRGRKFVDIVVRRLDEPSIRYDKITHAEILDLVKSQRAWILVYSICRTSLHTWVISPDGELNFRVTKISDDPRQESRLDKEIRNTVSDITNYENLNKLPKDGETRIEFPNLNGLSNFLIRPIEAWLPKRSADLVIIPAGLITLVPFSALPCGEKNEMMSQIYKIRSIPALIELERWRDDSSDVILTDSLIVGNPDVPSMLIPGQAEPWKQVILPNAEREANDVARLVNGHALVRREATKRRVMLEMSHAQLIHFATHGGQGGTSLFLAPEESERAKLQPGQLIDSKHCLLTCDEIEKMELKAHLVCLSSCGSGRGEPNNDGVMGLARSFLIAGAKAVLVTLWRVPDRATEELMRFFYRNLMRGAPTAFALQQAMHQLRCLEQFAHPVHWAGFQIIGPDITLEFPARFSVSSVPDCPFFVGMEKELNDLSEWVANKEDRLKVRYVQGIQPGIGKTTLVAEFIRMFHPYYSNIFWVRGFSNLMLLDGFCVVASIHPVAVTESLIIDRLYNYLRELGNWLLVIEGLWEKADITKYLPRDSDYGRVIVVCDYHVNIPSTPENVFSETSVGLLEQDDTIASLLRRTSTTVKPMSLTDEDRIALKKLTGMPFVLSLPINLELAGSYMRKSHTFFAKFHDLLLASVSGGLLPRDRKTYEEPVTERELSPVTSSSASYRTPGSSLGVSSEAARQQELQQKSSSIEISRCIVTETLQNLSDGACKLLGCFVASGARILSVDLLRDMARERERRLETSLEEDDVTEATFHTCLAEALSASLLKKHRDTVFIKRSSLEERDEGSTVVSIHSVVLQCLREKTGLTSPDMFQAWTAVFISRLKSEGPKNVALTQAIAFLEYVSGREVYTESLKTIISATVIDYPPAFLKTISSM